MKNLHRHVSNLDQVPVFICKCIDHQERGRGGNVQEDREGNRRDGERLQEHNHKNQL